MPRACGNASAPRLPDHGRTGARALSWRVGSRSALDHRKRDRQSQVKQATLQFCAGDLQAISHVGEAVAAIDLPKCVASSGTPEKIRHGLTCAGLYDLLAPNIFSATEVRNGKPAPDLFLFAAAQMGMSPERCLVVEDSIPGITGALAAGMTVFGFCGASHCRPGYDERLRAAGAATTFGDMRQLPGLIAQIDASAIAS